MVCTWLRGVADTWRQMGVSGCEARSPWRKMVGVNIQDIFVLSQNQNTRWAIPRCGTQLFFQKKSGGFQRRKKKHIAVQEICENCRSWSPPGSLATRWVNPTCESVVKKIKRARADRVRTRQNRGCSVPTKGRPCVKRTLPALRGTGGHFLRELLPDGREKCNRKGPHCSHVILVRFRSAPNGP